MKILGKLVDEEPWERKENDFDTSFVYENLDEPSMKMINKGIGSLMNLFPIALLFNKKIYQI